MRRKAQRYAVTKESKLVYLKIVQMMISMKRLGDLLPIVRIWTKTVSAGEASWTLARTARVAAHPEVAVPVQPPVAVVVHEVVPRLVGQVAPEGELLGVGGIVPHTLLRQHAHVDLQPEQREDRQGEHSEDDHIAEILDWVHDGTDDCF